MLKAGVGCHDPPPSHADVAHAEYKLESKKQKNISGLWYPPQSVLFLYSFYQSQITIPILLVHTIHSPQILETESFPLVMSENSLKLSSVDIDKKNIKNLKREKNQLNKIAMNKIASLNRELESTLITLESRSVIEVEIENVKSGA